MGRESRRAFWREAIAIQGSMTPQIMPLVLAFGLIATGICGIVWLAELLFQVRLVLEIAPFEIAGVALGLLLVLRTNTGYDRWWEARTIWGGIVNQSRNLVISALAYGPKNSEWRDEFVRWAAVFPHVARLSLRGEQPSSDVVNLIGQNSAERLAGVDHMPMFVALKLSDLLREARDKGEMDGFEFMQIDRKQALLIDHIGACERILRTPLPRVYSIKIRRFIVLFLLTVPLVLLHRLGNDWVVPFLTMLLSYPLLSLDQIGVELENPFSTRNLSHLPLDEISTTIERNLLGVLKEKQSESR